MYDLFMHYLGLPFYIMVTRIREMIEKHKQDRYGYINLPPLDRYNPNEE